MANLFYTFIPYSSLTSPKSMKANTHSVENMNMFDYLPSMQSVACVQVHTEDCSHDAPYGPYPSLSLDVHPPPLIEHNLTTNRLYSFGWVFYSICLTSSHPSSSQSQIAARSPSILAAPNLLPALGPSLGLYPQT